MGPYRSVLNAVGINTRINIDTGLRRAGKRLFQSWVQPASTASAAWIAAVLVVVILLFFRSRR